MGGAPSGIFNVTPGSKWGPAPVQFPVHPAENLGPPHHPGLRQCPDFLLASASLCT